jgi:hypothetical protein
MSNALHVLGREQAIGRSREALRKAASRPLQFSNRICDFTTCQGSSLSSPPFEQISLGE